MLKNINHKLSLRLDLIGTIASAACAVHCFLMPFIIITLTYYGMTFFNEPIVEIIFISVSLLIGIFTFRHGYKNHHRSLLPSSLFISGLIIIVISHFLFHGHHEHDVIDNLLLIIFAPIGAVIIAFSHYINRKLSKEKHLPSCNC
ncbi:MAG: MerC domain-containing protein [Ignavibacteria bacterium]